MDDDKHYTYYENMVKLVNQPLKNGASHGLPGQSKALGSFEIPGFFQKKSLNFFHGKNPWKIGMGLEDDPASFWGNLGLFSVEKMLNFRGVS